MGSVPAPIRPFGRVSRSGLGCGWWRRARKLLCGHRGLLRRRSAGCHPRGSSRARRLARRPLGRLSAATAPPPPPAPAAAAPHLATRALALRPRGALSRGRVALGLLVAFVVALLALHRHLPLVSPPAPPHHP